ncbi:MAG TPA: M43 family zinc metalloprotease, partial [Flavisolibacter sp.]|nr:M43 family zinc metalloprotease [Flavisolibacter sp.]
SVYAGTFPGAEGVGDMQIQFALANRDPNCNSTNGINRVNGVSIPEYVANGVFATTSGTDELAIKNFSRWDPSQYYNIWVVNKIDGADGTSGSFIAGFAYFPGDPDQLDGTVILATQMKAGAKTLPHELGHALSLYHPFEGSFGTTCVPASDCENNGDEICDTEPILQPTNLAGCRVGTTNPCTNASYSINSEKNFMNYASCFTLFTPDQKTRAQAAMNAPSRVSLTNSLGATPPNEGTTTCLPKINFELTDDRKAEAAGLSDGCRIYSDYTYKMEIGNAPTATATAVLTLGGTATEKVDYDITTNGSFSAPSKALTFENGAISSPSFTIRVYNDAIVDGTETVNLGFTLNNGGGNAIIGDARPNFIFTITDNDNAPVSGSSTGTGSIGTSLGALAQGPFDARQAKQRTQFLYRASELTAAGIPAGTISGLALNLRKNSTRPYTSFSIKVGSTLITNLIDDPDAYIVTGTTVKTITSYTTIAGWNNFSFDVPFNWNGTDNLVVEICYDNGVADAGDAVDNVLFYSDGGSATQGNLLWQPEINCSQAFTSLNGYTLGYKPIIQFNYGIPGTSIQSLVNTSKEEHLGPFADIYFYDRTENKLLARIRNLSNHDYGCTTVEIDRAGVNSTPFTTNTPSQQLLNKTIKITPTTNNASGQYEITLYYSNTEKTSWETATGQTWNNILLVKVPTQI